ncbi:modulator of drug activity B [Seinonella peptonophila]|uniref:Modulator of drug activity B n=1 Tax=Seinonella peptonophila TaxID=112248 RepID=A0A1M4UX65_9BACL|nr:NAD(P)H-dependent oxidoreductase [Seinonella peptonophila]SHE61268.1 modulator of drug activity B [Seinonella peptonophila]
MKRILIINGHASTDRRLNQTLVDHMVKRLQSKFEVKTSIIAAGYQIEEEVDKFRWADFVIFQTPIFWFSIPGIFKTYIDEVYQHGTFYRSANKYGTGGQFTDKKYMLSMTWNATTAQFSDPDQFFEGKNVDEAMFHFHKTQEFVGMKPLSSFSLHDVVKNPDIDQFLAQLDQHLTDVFSV